MHCPFQPARVPACQPPRSATRLITILFGFVALTFNLLCKDFPQRTHTHTHAHAIVLVLMWPLCRQATHTHTVITALPLNLLQFGIYDNYNKNNNSNNNSNTHVEFI